MLSRATIRLTELSRVATRQLCFPVTVRRSEPNPPRFKGLRALQLSCSFFRLSRPLFSMLCALLDKNTRGGMPTRIHCCAEAQKGRSVSPYSCRSYTRQLSPLDKYGRNAEVGVGRVGGIGGIVGKNEMGWSESRAGWSLRSRLILLGW